MSSNKIEISIKDIPEIIKTLEEAEKEIEFERKSKNLLIDDLYKVCEISLKQDKEIERLKEELEYTIPIVEHNKTITKHLKEIERLNNIINELEKYINEEYIYDELGMKIFDASKLQDKLEELKGGDKE